MIRRPEKNPGGSGEAGRHAGQLRGRGAESGALALVERVVGVVGAGEVAHHRAPGEGWRVLDDGREFARAEAEPRHAGIDMEDGWQSGAHDSLAAPRKGPGAVGGFDTPGGRQPDPANPIAMVP